MRLTVNRLQSYEDADAIFGELYIDEVLECQTLERASKAIQPGVYPVSFYFSPHNQLQVPLLTVPGREYIEIHPANYPNQLEGCIAVGMTHNQDSISNSRFAFSNLMSKIQNQTDLEIEVISVPS